MRPSLWSVVRAAASPKILAPAALLAAWVTGLVVMASKVGLWDRDRATDTVFWFVTAGLVLFGRFVNVSAERHFLRRTALATLELSALVQVLSEVFVLSLVAEVTLQPVFALLGGLSVVAAREREHRQVKTLVDGLILVGSTALLLYVVVGLANNWSSLDKGDLLQQFALPVWLTVGVLPYIYALGLLSAYEMAFIRIDWKSHAGRWARMRAKLVLLTSFHMKAREVGAFSGPWQFQLASTGSFRDGRRLIAEFRRAQRAEVRAAAEKQARLVRYSGVDGVDERGRRLDRREFEDTTAALRWVATCQMGWYNNQGQYRADLLDFVLDGFAGKRLPDPPGFHMLVSGDGQKWFALRETVTGWIFAIGAAGPPPDHWEYDGPEPPADFPGEDPAWGTRSFGLEANANW
ncbi:MAG TPA: hypothetical protein VHH09_06720 [Acidimicrobiales bacterium]|nr:hypothetical protein [Acidimicrobiales bacterium]